MSEFEFYSRYGGPGDPVPDPATMCPGDCEGMGLVPIREDEDDPAYAGLWAAAEASGPTDDGYHFVRCPTCGGTGKRAAAEERT